MKRKILLLLMCLAMACGILAMSASATFQVTYYNEEVYAGGVLDMYALVGESDLSGYTFRWQFKGLGDHWMDLEDNETYRGTKTNHLQFVTYTEADYAHWDEIPFQCMVTKDGFSQYTPVLYMRISPYENMLEAMQSKGIGLYEPNLSNVAGLSTQDNVTYTATACAGSNLEISCGGSSESQMSMLKNSEVQLKREIKITENGKYILTGDETSYIPYTIGTNAVKIEISMRILMSGVDRGIYQTKTVYLTTRKPDTIAAGKTTSACSLLRYTYNESEKLASIAKGTALEIVGKTGSYYQVYYNGLVGYVSTSLMDADVDEPKIIEHLQLRMAEPAAGNVWPSSVTVEPTGCFATSVEWYDKTAGKYLTSGERFVQGHDYQVAIWVSAGEGYRFKLDSNNKMLTTAILNGELPCFTSRAYEQVIGKVIDIRYDFNNVQQAQASHSCAPVLVPRVEPTCTAAGHEAYYRCACGKAYSDSQGKDPVDASVWGVIPPGEHSYTDWQYNIGQHYKNCLYCDEVFFVQAHTGGKATCTQKPRCEICGCFYGMEEPAHKWSDCWEYDENFHWHTCTVCGEPDPGSRTNHHTDMGKCTACGYEAGEVPTLPPQTAPQTQVTQPTPQTQATQPAAKPDSTAPAADSLHGNTQQAKSAVDPLAAVLVGVGSFFIAITATVMIYKKRGTKK